MIALDIFLKWRILHRRAVDRLAAHCMRILSQGIKMTICKNDSGAGMRGKKRRWSRADRGRFLTFRKHCTPQSVDSSFAVRETQKTDKIVHPSHPQALFPPPHPPLSQNGPDTVVHSANHSFRGFSHEYIYTKHTRHTHSSEQCHGPRCERFVFTALSYPPPPMLLQLYRSKEYLDWL